MARKARDMKRRMTTLFSSGAVVSGDPSAAAARLAELEGEEAAEEAAAAEAERAALRHAKEHGDHEKVLPLSPAPTRRASKKRAPVPEVVPLSHLSSSLFITARPRFVSLYPSLISSSFSSSFHHTIGRPACQALVAAKASGSAEVTVSVEAAEAARREATKNAARATAAEAEAAELRRELAELRATADKKAARLEAALSGAEDELSQVVARGRKRERPHDGPGGCAARVAGASAKGWSGRVLRESRDECKGAGRAGTSAKEGPGRVQGAERAGTSARG